MSKGFLYNSVHHNRQDLDNSLYFPNKYSNKKLKIPQSLVKKQDQYNQKSIFTPYTKIKSPFHQKPSTNHHIFHQNQITNPFYKKYLHLPNHYQQNYRNSNHSIYTDMDGSKKLSNIYSYQSQQQQFRKSWYFSRYQLQKLRNNIKKQGSKENYILKSQNLYHNHYNTPEENNLSLNIILRSIAELDKQNNDQQIINNISYHQTFNYNQQKNNKRGMFADIFSKVVKKPYCENQQIRNLKKAQTQFFEILSKVKDVVKSHRIQQNQEEKILSARSLFFDLYIRMEKQKYAKSQEEQITKGKKRFAEVYIEMQKMNSMKQFKLQNDQLIKARAIFGQVYLKMYDAAINQKQNGYKDFQNQSKAKRLFDQVYSRMVAQINNSSKKSQNEESQVYQYQRRYDKNSQIQIQIRKQDIQTQTGNHQKSIKQKEVEVTYKPQIVKENYPQKLEFKKKDYYLIK